MGIFDFFKKKKGSDYDPTNLRITDLRKGFVHEYDFKSWIVKAEYEYDWGGNCFSYEYKLDSGDEEMFLSIDNDDHIELAVMKKIKTRAIEDDLPEYIRQNEKPPKKLVFNGVTYYRDNEAPGYFRNTEDPENESVEFITWDYYDETEKLIITIEQWGEDEFEAAYGKVVNEYEFSNILPAETN